MDSDHIRGIDSDALHVMQYERCSCSLIEKVISSGLLFDYRRSAVKKTILSQMKQKRQIILNHSILALIRMERDKNKFAE